MKLSLNNNDLLVLKHEKCEDCTFNPSYNGFCIFLHTICVPDSKIFHLTSYNSNIFNL